jgi:hypothetical protein
VNGQRELGGHPKDCNSNGQTPQWLETLCPLDLKRSEQMITGQGV